MNQMDVCGWTIFVSRCGRYSCYLAVIGAVELDCVRILSSGSDGKKLNL